MQIKFNNSISNNVDCLVLAIGEELTLTEEMQSLNQKIDNAISEAIKFGSFKGKKGEIFQIFGMHENLPKMILLVGYGKITDIIDTRIMYLGGRIIASLHAIKAKSAQIIGTSLNLENYDVPALIAQGAAFRNFRFDKYRTQEKPEDKPLLSELVITSENPEKSEEYFSNLKSIVEGVYLTRNLVSEPPNVIYPETLAKEAEKLKEHGIEVEVLGLEDMKRLGMGSILGVAQGSVKEPKIAIMKYKGIPTDDQIHLALVGKGVTFDTGGISIKPAQGMEDMKYDMAGSAVVIGTMKSIALRKAKANIVGLIGIVENMPDGNAQRPSDVVKSMSGQTIEVLNTDAEGRLVLADVLWYCQDRFKPNYIIDLATLTGAITISFGMVYAGLFSNNDELADKLFDSGIKSDEKLWRMPMGEVYDKMLNSEIADMQNISTEKGAGSITAAQFLQRFVNNTPWAHLDIAGMSWTKKDNDIVPKGATAFGVRLLNRLIQDHFEK
ncbi:MAG: leucyl aminopeptidase [Alphaproteobacteria bacterium]